MGINNSKDGSMDASDSMNSGDMTIPPRKEKRYDEPSSYRFNNTNNNSNNNHNNNNNNNNISSSANTSNAMSNSPRSPGLSPHDYNINVISSSGEMIPHVFKWDHGGRNVYITGTFNNWDKQIPMHRSGNDFTYVHNLPKGKHAYKFIVDDEWRFAPDQPTVADIEGRINNFVDVTEFVPYTGDDAFFEKSKERKIPDEDFKQHIPDLDEYTKEPPALPPHLRHIILNKPPPAADPQSLPIPQQVGLNHLYCTAIKDGMMVLGGTQRYKEKFTTVVFYSVMPA